MSNVEDRVKKIVAEQLGVKEDIANDASFVDDLGADSLDTVELVMALEEEFECEIPDDEAEKITTVQQAIDYVEKNAWSWFLVDESSDPSTKSSPAIPIFTSLTVNHIEQTSSCNNWIRRRYAFSQHRRRNLGRHH